MQKTILVTGASTGIGYDAVRILIENNFSVVGTVRKEEDKQNLLKNFGDRVKVLKLDVAHLDQIEKLPEMLKNEFQITELFGLVNNAGVAHAGPFAYQDFSELEQMIHINVLGLMKVTQVLLPLLGLKAGADGKVSKDGVKGRIVNISSVAGQSTAPFLAGYAASKHAVEGLSAGLRRELMIAGIKVIVIGPGSIKTPIWDKGFMKVSETYKKTIYSEAVEKFIGMVQKKLNVALEVSEVSDCILDAFTAEDPKFRYYPVPEKMQNVYLPKLLPERMFNKMVAKFLNFK